MPTISGAIAQVAQLNLTDAASRIVPGATSLALRNNANTANNVLVADTGAVTLRSTLALATTLGVGAATPAASGAGVSFPATQNASADVNTFDDYEEGSWTPAVGGTATYTTQTGRYVKKGKEVTIFCKLVINLIGTGSTTVISGLPFTAASGINNGGGISYFTGIATNVVALFASVDGGANVVTLRSLTAAAASIGGSAILANGTEVGFTLTFEASA